MTQHTHEPIIEDEIHYCAKHPERDTELRCNRCGRYMCIQCAVKTPVGYTCKECVRGHEDRFFTGSNIDYIITSVVCVIGGAAGGWIVSLFGFNIWLLFIASPVIGGGISQLALRLTGRRRGRYSGYIGAAAVIAGGLAIGFMVGFSPYLLLYLGLVGSSAYAGFKISI